MAEHNDEVGIDVRAVRNLWQKRTFVDIPFRILGGDPNWVPPLRLSVYDRLSKRHPANVHQNTKLWLAYRNGKAVGRIGACVDSYFNEHQNCSWGWVGFFDTFDEPGVASALFGAAWRWLQSQGMSNAVGPASFTTNDELGLLVEGFEDPPSLMTTENPRYYEDLWTGAGWAGAMDLYAWRFDRATTALSARQEETLERLRRRSKVTVRSMNADDWDAEVSRFYAIYNAAWSDNWGFAPMPEPEIHHLAKQLKSLLNPEWAFGIEREGELIGVCLAVPDANQAMVKVRNGRLFPYGWWPLLRQVKRSTRARVLVLGVRPESQNLAVGPLLYHEIVRRLAADPYIQTAEASWTLATNDRINNQLEAMGATRSKVWRLYQHAL